MIERIHSARRACATVLFTSLLALAGTSPAAAATYFVATTGSDADAGTELRPFRTITFAYNRANAGDTIIVKPGTYTDFTTAYGLRLHRSGTASSPITVRSEQRGAAILDGQNRADRPDVIWVSGHYNIVDGFDIRNGFLGGIIVFGTHNQLRNNVVHNNGNSGDPASTNGQPGIYSDRAASGTVYWANHVHHNGRIAQDSNLDHGFYLTGNNEVVANNIVTYNSAYGIHVAGTTRALNAKIYNNVSAWNGRSGMMLWQQVDGVDIRNNILCNNRMFGIDTYDAHGTGVLIDRNIVFGNGSGTLRLNNGGSDFLYNLGTTLTSNPLFTNTTAQNFRLQSSSPAIDAGYVVSLVPSDFDGVTRPLGASTDIGPHEYQGGLALSGAPSNLRLVAGK